MEIKTLKTLLIINPSSGTGHKRKTIPRLVFFLQSHFPELEIAFTQKGGDASKLVKTALEKGTEMILCAGGDGTINEVANPLYGTTVLLGILPTGTGNGLAREIGLSLNPMKAAEQILSGKAVPVYPALMNHQKYLLVSGAGYDAFVAHQVDRFYPRLKRLTGFFAYFLTGAVSFWKYPFPPMRVHIGEKSVSCYGLLILKSRANVGPLPLAPVLSLQSPQLGAFIFKKKGAWSIILFFLAFLCRLHLSLKNCPFYLLNEIKAESDNPVLTQFDGEEGNPLPAVWKSADKHIFLIYPGKETK